MDVYELILERGCIGALSYANQIEKDNIKLASEIDEAVAGLLRIASGETLIKTAQAYPQQRYAPPTNIIAPRSSVPLPPMSARLPNNNPAAFDPAAVQSNLPQAPKGTVTKGMDYLEGHAMGTNPYVGRAKIPVIAAQLIMPLKRVNILVNGAIKAIKSAPAGSPQQLEALDKVAEIIARTPNAGVGGMTPATNTLLDSVFGSGFVKSGKTIREALTDRVLGEIGPNVLTREHFMMKLSDAVFTSQNMVQKWVPGANKMMSVLGKDFKNELHPLIKSMPNGEQWIKDFEAVTGTSAKGKTLADIDKIVGQAVNAGKTGANTLKADLLGHMGQTGVMETAIALPSKSESMLTQLIGKFPGLKILFKFLGPLVVAYDGWNLKSEVDKYGWDAKNVCNGLSFLAGVCSLIPPIAPVAMVIWGLMSVGCMFTPAHDDKKTVEKQNEPILVQIQKRAKEPIKLDILSPKDQALAKALFNQYKDQGDYALKKAWDEAEEQKKWDNYIDAGALLIKEIEEGGIFSPSEPIKPKTMDEPVVKAFNLEKYRLRTAQHNW